MRRLAALVAFAAFAMMPAACRKEPEGTLRVLVIGAHPSLRDPALGPLPLPDEVLLANVAQGLVRFDVAGNIVPGLAERWTVSDDGLSYIFRIASTNWADRRKVTAEQVARLIKRQLAGKSRNSLKDALGGVEDIVAMTDRVIEIQLAAPRPNLLALLAQPQMPILRNGQGTGPFVASTAGSEIKLTREITSLDDETTTRQEVMLGGASAPDAIANFAQGKADLVLGGTFGDLPLAQRLRLPRGSLRFDPASGLFGLVPTKAGGAFDSAAARQFLSEAIDRDSFVAALGVPGLAARATLLEPGLEGVAAVPAPAWQATPYADRVLALQAQAHRLFPKAEKPPIRLSLPEGPGAELLLRLLQRDWGAFGFTVERAANAAAADFSLIDEVAPSASPAWFARRFRCGAAPVCDPAADALMDAARMTPVPGQRYAFFVQAAAVIDTGELFLPIAAPVRWSLVSARIQNFAGNRYARHTLTDLEDKPNGD